MKAHDPATEQLFCTFLAEGTEADSARFRRQATNIGPAEEHVELASSDNNHYRSGKVCELQPRPGRHRDHPRHHRLHQQRKRIGYR